MLPRNVSTALLLAALFVPLAGCIGEEDAPEAPVVTGGSDIKEGIPPEKFTFEPVALKPEGVAQRERRERQTCVGGVPVLCDTAIEWRLTWNVTGLQPIGVGDNKDEIGETWYTAWVAKEDRQGGIFWEHVARTDSVAVDGTHAGATAWGRLFKDYVGVQITIETITDSTPEVVVLQVLEMEPENLDPHPLVDMEPFTAAFADAKVVTTDGKVDLTVQAYSLPETSGAYDVFLRRSGKDTYLGTLKLDPTSGGHALTITPDPKLFTTYQFLISLEGKKDGKEEAKGMQILTSKFKS